MNREEKNEGMKIRKIGEKKWKAADELIAGNDYRDKSEGVYANNTQVRVNGEEGKKENTGKKRGEDMKNKIKGAS